MDWLPDWITRFTWFDWFVFVSGVAAVWLTVRQHLLNWPVGIISSAAVLVVAVQHKLYADGALQVVYIVLGFYGWWHWYFGNPTQKDALPVTRTPRRERLPLVVATVAVYVSIGSVLTHLTDSDVPWLDAFPTSASLLAQYLLTRKYLATWPVWIFAVNLPFAALYVSKGLYLLAVLQPIYVGLSVAGWRQWRRSLGAPHPRAVDPVAAPS